MPYSLSDDVLQRIIQIESGGDPNAVTGKYTGILQMGPDEIKQYGGNGVAEGKRLIEDRANQLEKALGRPVTDAEAYLAHQQGVGGATAHLSNPDRPAWESMYATAEGQKKGPAWAKQAIWGNLPDSAKANYGSVDNVSSGDFATFWAGKMGGTPTQVARAPIAPALQAPEAPAKAASPMGALPAFDFTPKLLPGGNNYKPDPSKPLQGPQTPNPLNMADISQFQQLTPLQWVRLFRG